MDACLNFPAHAVREILPRENPWGYNAGPLHTNCPLPALLPTFSNLSFFVEGYDWVFRGWSEDQRFPHRIPVRSVVRHAPQVYVEFLLFVPCTAAAAAAAAAEGARAVGACCPSHSLPRSWCLVPVPP